MGFLVGIFKAILGIASGATTIAEVAGPIGGIPLMLGLNAVQHLLSPKIGSAGSPTDFKANPYGGFTLAVGRCGLGGDIVLEQTSAGDKNRYLHIIAALSCCGPHESIDTFYANREAVTFSAAPASKASSGTWQDVMWLRTQLGTQPATLLTAPSGTGSVPEWTSTHLLSGKAAYRWILKYDQDKYTSIPKPLVVGHWAKVWDPRLDSTYPGGSGSQRSTDQTTWAWSENPYLCALAWCLGYKENGVRVMGIGALQAQIDVEAFVSGANVADANSWKVAGLFSSKDSKWEVLKALLQAGAGQPLRLGHQISCTCETSRTSLATVTSADFLSGVRVPGTVTRTARINQVTPKYLSEDHFWEYVDASPVTISAYVTADGQLRPKGVDYKTCPDVDQAAQLAAYAIYGAREVQPISGQMKPIWNALRPGDCITVNDPEFLLSSQKVVVLTRTRDLASGAPTFTFRTETDAKHAAALGQTGTAPPTPTVNAISFTPDAPDSTAWTVAGTTITNSGVSLPALVLTGAVEAAQSGLVTDFHVYYRPTASPAVVSSYGTYGAAATRVEVTSVANAGVYDLGLAYIGRGGEGAITWFTNSGSGYTAGTFVGSGVSDDKTPTAVNWTMAGASGGNPTTDTSNSQTFASINIPITLTLNTSGVSGSGTLEYQKNGGAWTTFTSGGTVAVSLGDSLAFRATNSTSSSTYSGTLTIVNTTDSSTTLDTVAWSATCGGSDVTPDSVSWDDLYEFGGAGEASNAAQTFTGLSASITLTITRTGSSVTMQYSKNGGAWTTVASGGTLSVANNDTIAWKVYNFTPGEYSGSFTVVNTTDGSTLLATIVYDIIAL